MQALAVALVVVACLAANLVSDIFIAPTNKELAHHWSTLCGLGFFAVGALLFAMGVWTLKDDPPLEDAPEAEPAHRPLRETHVYRSSRAV